MHTNRYLVHTLKNNPALIPLSIKGFNAPCRSSQRKWEGFFAAKLSAAKLYSLTPDLGAVFFYRLLLCHLSPRCAWILLWQCLQSEMRFDVSCVPPSDKGLMWCTSSTGTITPFLKHCSQKGCVCAYCFLILRHASPYRFFVAGFLS